MTVKEKIKSMNLSDEHLLALMSIIVDIQINTMRRTILNSQTDFRESYHSILTNVLCDYLNKIFSKVNMDNSILDLLE